MDPRRALPWPAAAGAAACVTAVYVGALYALVPRGVRERPRDDPVHIAWRSAAVAAACALAPALTWAVLARRLDGADLAAVMGVNPGCWTPLALAGPVVSIGALFLGPLVHAALEAQRAAAAAPAGGASRAVTLRNLVVSPLAEEWVFRCCVLPLFWATGASRAAAVVATAATFAAAHMHHVVELTRRGWALRHAAGAVGAQAGYTFVFGCLAAHALAVTRAAPGPLAMHVWCNWWGLPDLSWAVVPPRTRADAARRAVVAAAYAVGIAAWAAWTFWWLTAQMPRSCGGGGGPAKGGLPHHHRSPLQPWPG
jgi:prenyl protein peptidase